jgi:phenylpropionate dioxygenase-like ring-hydroxylating dioxygenase large terminal subunit
MTDATQAQETVVWNEPGSAVRVPVYRYLSADFAELEEQQLWPRVWQIACSVDDVAEAGDYYEYRAGPYSVLIVRGDDGKLRAFQNVCRHRGNSICEGSGAGLTRIRCPWHHWTWDLHGQLREVPSRKWFGGLVNDEYPLFPVQVDEWARIVWVNLDTEAAPLLEYLEGIPADTAWADLDEFRCAAVTRTPVDCNWKVIADGFGETYHVQGIHEEMLGSMDDVNTRQRLWRHHGVSYQQYGVPSPRLGREVSDRVVWDSFIDTQGARMGPEYAQRRPAPPVPEGETMLDVIAQKIRGHHASLGTDLTRFTSEQILMLAQYNVFPNSTVLVWGEMLNVLLGRPGSTPDQSELVTYTFYRAPSADAPRSRPVEITLPADVRGTGVIAQDIAVLQTAQRGLRQPGLTHLTLSSEECRILNMQRNLERYLGIEPTELEPLTPP